MSGEPPTPVCIIGAGPYGVSIAAHLRARGLSYRIFGISMHRWRRQMPIGMFLKSEGCASNLYDALGEHTLGEYCARQRLPFQDRGMPVTRETFADYALSFQQSLVPDLEELMVASVGRAPDGFDLVLSNGERLRAKQVVVATGLEHMAFAPPVLDRLPAELVSHSADLHDLRPFKGREVIIIGGGQSALETGALLAEQGTSVRVLVRNASLAWNPIPKTGRPTLYERIRHPRTDLGDGLQLWFYTNAPGLFRHLPQRVRADRANHVLGPAGGWWLKERVLGRLPITHRIEVRGAEVRSGRLLLHLADDKGELRELTADHVIAATGYQFQLKRLPFLSEWLRTAPRQQQGKPVLSANFESSVPGLYFAGLASSYSFGPVMRFLCGASYTARCVSKRLAECRDGRRPGTSATVRYQKFQVPG